MGLLDWLPKRPKTLTQMNRKELRVQELRLKRERTRMLNLVEKLSKEKQGLFERGAKETMPEVRRMLAQEFEMKTTEQLMTSRQLNIRSKEMLTVSRLRMLRENADRAKSTGGKLGLISEKDIIRLGKLIESENITTEMYQERLDDILSAGAVEEGTPGLSDAGQTVMNIWDKMDTGAIADSNEAFDEADRRVREQQSAPAEE